MSILADDWIRKHRIDVDEYYRMAEVGLLAPDARVELIQGEVIDMAPMGSRHASVINVLNRLLTRAVNESAIVSVQLPLRLDRRSEPQPDVMLLKPRTDFYRSAHPSAADVLLLIEVSDASLRYDREIKLPLYARHFIPEVWLIDINSEELQHCCQPIGQTYASVTRLTGGDIELRALPGIRIDLSVVLKL